MKSLFDKVGGRKAFNGYVATALLTVMALVLRAGYTEYAGAILLALGITSGLIAFEDSRRPKDGGGS